MIGAHRSAHEALEAELDDSKQIKERCRFRCYAHRGLIIETKLLDNAVYLRWENNSQQVFKNTPASPGYIIGDHNPRDEVEGYRALGTRPSSLERELFFTGRGVTGDLIDHDIKPGVTTYYRFTAWGIFYGEATIGEVRGSRQSWRYKAREHIERIDLDFSVYVPAPTDALELLRRRLQIKKMEREAMSAVERQILEREEVPLRVQAQLRQLENLNELLKQEIEKTKAKGLPPEEEEAEIKIKTRIIINQIDRLGL